MIITRTPYRISFFGGGTDYHTWYQENGGSVLSTTINYYCTLVCTHKPPFFENKHRIVWSQIENVNEADEINHPVVREVMKHMNIQRGLEVFHQGDLPARSGIGSSSSFTVGFLNAMYALRGQMSTKQQLAAEAVHVERELLKESVGVQDQIAAAYGGLNRINIHPDGNFEVQPLTISPIRSNELKSHLMLFYTGIARNASEVAEDKIAKIPSKKAELTEMQKMVDIATNILTSGQDINDFGKLLHETWQLKRGISGKISSDFIDDLYTRAKAAGATGGKLLGAGGGGFMLFFVKPQYQQKVLEALSELLWVPFDFERHGSHVAFYSPTSFTRESLLRRDYAHLGDGKQSANIQNIQNFIKPETETEIQRPTKFQLVK
jgi:D-glycero-alpha-D-manno-heptose-7-phosphate kinase